jgi:hypothetical protein
MSTISAAGGVGFGCFVDHVGHRQIPNYERKFAGCLIAVEEILILGCGISTGGRG